jgi:hypothetical protein
LFNFARQLSCVYESGPPPCTGLPPHSPREQYCSVMEADQLTIARWWKTGSRNTRLRIPVKFSVEKTQGQRRNLGEAMNNLANDVPKFVTQARASYLLGIPREDLRRLSEESGFGHVERAGDEEELYFTYEELRRICEIAFQVTASH